MCNLYAIGPARHTLRHDWERAFPEAFKRLEKPFGIRKRAIQGLSSSNGMGSRRPN